MFTSSLMWYNAQRWQQNKYLKGLHLRPLLKCFSIEYNVKLLLRYLLVYSKLLDSWLTCILKISTHLMQFEKHMSIVLENNSLMQSIASCGYGICKKNHYISFLSLKIKMSKYIKRDPWIDDTQLAVDSSVFQ